MISNNSVGKDFGCSIGDDCCGGSRDELRTLGWGLRRLEKGCLRRINH